MVINVARPGFHGANQRQLLVVNVFNQMGEIVIAVCRPGPRQIRGIAVIFRAGVEQKAAHLRRSAMVQFGVVQDGSMLVQRHDVAVRHVGIAVTGGGKIGLVDIEFAHPGLKSLIGRTMTIHRRLLRFTHTGQLVIGFVSPVVMQIIDNPFRVDLIRGDSQAQRALRHRPDIANITASGRQLAADAIGLRQRDHIDLFGPERGRQRLNVMPVINRQIEPQLRFIHTVHQQPAVRHLSHRHPGFELRIDLERVWMVIKEDVNQLAGVNQQSIHLKTGQDVAGTFL